jgi:hypothetical protein
VPQPELADIIWLLAPWNVNKIQNKILEEKFVVTTIHHIDFTKYDKKRTYYNYINKITNRYHAINKDSKLSIQKITNKKILVANFWINNQVFFEIQDKGNIRQKHNISLEAFVVGSFQKDTENSRQLLPKLSKGPDIFIKIIMDLAKSKKNVVVLLSGWRRDYIISQLKKNNIKYIYKELVEDNELNELYNCLNLYIVSSRVEGGPRSILECAISKTPIISTKVGIAKDILSPESLFDSENFISYRDAIPNVTFAYEQARKLKIKDYIPKFVSEIFHELNIKI